MNDLPDRAAAVVRHEAPTGPAPLSYTVARIIGAATVLGLAVAVVVVLVVIDAPGTVLAWLLWWLDLLWPFS